MSSPVRVGDTVRRTSGPWTPTVQALLDYLVTHRFDYAPRPMGLDEQGREMLEFLPGASGHRPWPDVLKGDSGLLQAAGMLRRYHEVVAGFVPPADAQWRIGRRTVKAGEIIRHGDLGPWNMLWQGEKLTGLVDWDLAEPGERITDVAQLAWYFVPLRGEQGWRDSGFELAPDVRTRLGLLCGAYGDFEVDQVLREVDRLQRADMEITQRLGGGGVHPWSIFYERNGMAVLRMENAWLQQYLN